MITKWGTPEAFYSPQSNIASDVYNVGWYGNGYFQFPANSYVPGTFFSTNRTTRWGNWQWEGIIGYQTGNTPIYRYYNISQKDRVFTNDFSELNYSNGNHGYSYEFIAFYLN